MRESIDQCVEELQERVLKVAENGQGIGEILDALGLSHMRLNSAQLIAVLDMLIDGITPVNDEIVTACLNVCEAHKRFLYAISGLLRKGDVVEEQAPAAKSAPEEEPQAEAPSEDMAGMAAMAKEMGMEEDMAEETADMPVPEPKPDPEPMQPEAKPAEQAKTPAKPDKAPAPQAISSIRVPTDRLDRVIELVGKLMVTYAVIAQGGAQNMNQVAASLRELDNVISQLQKEVDAIRLVPLKQIFMPMHRLVKSLSQKIGKKLDFEVKGEELPLDKTIVESLNEPLVHLLRNAVDHGLELPDERKTAGKPEIGHVTLSAWRKGEYAYISVQDDGKGMDPERILNKALEKGIAEAGAEYSEEEILQFVLQSGFSTAEKITDVSGRGVGMDAVVNAIRVSLDGDVEISSELGKGSEFTISIPLDRSANEGIVDALVCKVGGDVFIIPSRDVVEIYMPKLNEVVELPDGRETVDVRGSVHSLLRLADLLGLTAEVEDIQLAQAVVVRVGEYKAAILVDEVLRQQQVVITGFTVPVEEVFDIPILGYGMMGESDALVINTEELLQNFQDRIHRENRNA